MFLSLVQYPFSFLGAKYRSFLKNPWTEKDTFKENNVAVFTSGVYDLIQAENNWYDWAVLPPPHQKKPPKKGLINFKECLSFSNDANGLAH